MKIRIKNTGEVVNVSNGFFTLFSPKPASWSMSTKSHPRPLQQLTWKLELEEVRNDWITASCSTCRELGSVNRPTLETTFRCRCGVGMIPANLVEAYNNRAAEKGFKPQRETR
jgi:hypothetical protein